MFAAVIQLIESSNKNRFHFNFHHKEIEMTFCELLAFRNKISAIDINTHFYSETNLFGIEVISLCNLRHVLVLETEDVLKLKSIIQNIFSSQELELKY